MSDTNIERFDELVGKAFALLYASFPLPQTLSPSIFIDGDKIMRTDQILGETYSDEFKFCMATLIWLHEAGYISAREVSPLALSYAVLTAKGLEALKAVPDSLQGSIGERLIEAAKIDGREAIRSLVGEALKAGIQLMLG